MTSEIDLVCFGGKEKDRPKREQKERKLLNDGYFVCGAMR